MKPPRLYMVYKTAFNCPSLVEVWSNLVLMYNLRRSSCSVHRTFESRLAPPDSKCSISPQCCFQTCYHMLSFRLSLTTKNLTHCSKFDNVASNTNFSEVNKGTKIQITGKDEKYSDEGTNTEKKGVATIDTAFLRPPKSHNSFSRNNWS